jgi:hypothetical protein
MEDQGLGRTFRVSQRDQLLKISPLPQVKKPKWYRGKSIVSDGPSPPSVQPPEEEDFFLIFQWETD